MNLFCSRLAKKNLQVLFFTWTNTIKQILERFLGNLYIVQSETGNVH